MARTRVRSLPNKVGGLSPSTAPPAGMVRHTDVSRGDRIRWDSHRSDCLARSRFESPRRLLGGSPEASLGRQRRGGLPLSEGDPAGRAREDAINTHPAGSEARGSHPNKGYSYGRDEVPYDTPFEGSSKNGTEAVGSTPQAEPVSPRNAESTRADSSAQGRPSRPRANDNAAHSRSPARVGGALSLGVAAGIAGG